MFPRRNLLIAAWHLQEQKDAESTYVVCIVIDDSFMAASTVSTYRTYYGSTVLLPVVLLLTNCLTPVHATYAALRKVSCELSSRREAFAGANVSATMKQKFLLHNRYMTSQQIIHGTPPRMSDSVRCWNF
jgi:hypothetical protein